GAKPVRRHVAAPGVGAEERHACLARNLDHQFRRGGGGGNEYEHGRPPWLLLRWSLSSKLGSTSKGGIRDYCGQITPETPILSSKSGVQRGRAGLAVLSEIDSKSVVRKDVSVRVGPGAPH